MEQSRCSLASDQGASGTSIRVRALEKAKDPLQGLHIPVGQAGPWGTPGESVAGEQEAWSRTLNPALDKQKRMDGWMDG